MHYYLFAWLFMQSVLAQSYSLEILVNGVPVTYSVESGYLDGDSSVLTFEGGKLELNLSDWNTFDYAHVLETTFNKTAPGIYTVSATIRHHDTGWDNYADAFEVKGKDVQNGLRVLTHPHETKQFTRSQSGVVAKGLVWVEAKDNVEGLGGSKIYLDLLHPNLVSQDKITIRYTLK
jgi:hypothetical protein